MGDRRDIPISRLLLDPENPRLPQIGTDPDDTLHQLVASQPEKILALVDDIVSHGLDPTNSLLAIPATEAATSFIVLEGNRRLAALKLLDHPELAGSALTAAQTKRMRALSSSFRPRRIEVVSVFVVGDRDEAAHWLETRHQGELGGAGLVPWGGQERARFADRLGGPKNPALQLLDLVERSPLVNQHIRKRVRDVPITNLQRLINDPDVRTAIGIEREGSDVRLLYPLREVLKPLARIVRQLADEEVRVTHIDTKELRADYVASFPAKDLPDPKRRLGGPMDLAAATGSALPSPPSRRKTTSSRPLGARRTLVPHGTSYDISNGRIAAIFREIGRLHVDEFPNAVAVSFRVFLELSVDHHVLKARLMSSSDWNNASLPKKVQLVADDLVKNGVLTREQLAPVRRAVADRRLLAVSINTLHGYVHNKDFSPIPGDLKIAWDDLSPFFGAIWRPEETP